MTEEETLEQLEDGDELPKIDFTDIKRWNYVLIENKVNPDSYRLFGRCTKTKRNELKIEFDKVLIITNETVSFKTNYTLLKINGFDQIYDTYLMDQETYLYYRNEVLKQLSEQQ